MREERVRKALSENPSRFVFPLSFPLSSLSLSLRKDQFNWLLTLDEVGIEEAIYG